VIDAHVIGDIERRGARRQLCSAIDAAMAESMEYGGLALADSSDLPRPVLADLDIEA
jgi:hypothetical protein